MVYIARRKRFNQNKSFFFTTRRESNPTNRFHYVLTSLITTAAMPDPDAAKTKIRLDAVKDLDLYGLLDVALEATEKEIKKAYRKKALVCHPDKNPGDEKAAERFHLLSQALAVLSDPAARKAYDAVLKAKQAALVRSRQLDQKRKKLKDELDARENAAAAAAADQAKAKESSERSLQKELERLQEEGRKQLEEEQERLSQMVKQAATASAAAAATTNDGPVKLKVKWKGGVGYTKEQLQSVFHKYGDVVNVVVLAEKKAGLVEMKSRSAAQLASQIETGYSDNQFKVKLLGGEAEFKPSRPAAVPVTNDSFGSSEKSFNDYETLVMRQMRQAEERRRLEAEILAQDAAPE